MFCCFLQVNVLNYFSGSHITPLSDEVFIFSEQCMKHGRRKYANLVPKWKVFYDNRNNEYWNTYNLHLPIFTLLLSLSFVYILLLWELDLAVHALYIAQTSLPLPA